MNVAFHLRCVGSVLILLGVAHGWFGKKLNWETELKKLSLVNRQIFLVHCFYIALFLVLLGSLSIWLTPFLLQPSPLSQALLGASTLLWCLRLYIQWFVFDRSLRRESRFNQWAHYLLSAFWMYATVVNGWAFWSVRVLGLPPGQALSK